MGSVGWFCLLGVLMPACASGPYMKYEEYYTTMGTERYLGGGCVLAGEEGLNGSSSSGAAGGANQDMQPYSIAYEGRSVGITVSVKDGTGHLLAQRDYSNDFLDTGKSDDIVVPLEDDVLRLHIFGAQDCNDIKVPEGD